MEEAILSYFETVHAVRLAHSVNITEDQELILNIYETDLKTSATSLSHSSPDGGEGDGEGRPLIRDV